MPQESHPAEFYRQKLQKLAPNWEQWLYEPTKVSEIISNIMSIDPAPILERISQQNHKQYLKRKIAKLAKAASAK